MTAQVRGAGTSISARVSECLHQFLVTLLLTATTLSASSSFGLSLTARTKRETSAGEVVQYLRHGGPTLARILSEIENAESSIDLATYIFEAHHSVARLLIDSLVRTLEVKRQTNPNFRIRLLIDAFTMSPTTKQMLAYYLAQHGIELRVFNDSFGFPMNHRMHVKMILIDGVKVIMGGRNIADYEFGVMSDDWAYDRTGKKEITWYDKDVLVTGAATNRAASATFESYWNQLSAPPVFYASANEAHRWSQENLSLGDRERSIKYLLFTYQASIDREDLPPVRCNDVSFIADEAHFAIDGPGVIGSGPNHLKASTRAVVDFVSNVQSHFETENHMFQPTGLLRKAFESLKQREIPVLVVVNKVNDSEPVTRLTQHYTRDFNGGAFHVKWITGNAPDAEYWFRTRHKVDTKVHSKVYTSDGKDTLVSSFNIDGRSYLRNYEAVLRVRNCPAFAKQVEKDIRQTASFAEEVSGEVSYSGDLIGDLLFAQDEY